MTTKKRDAGKKPKKRKSRPPAPASRTPPAPSDRWEVTLEEYFPPSLNQIAMAHWSVVRKHKSKAMQRLYIAAICGPGGVRRDLPVFDGPVKVTITRLWGNRQRALDQDNLIGAVKPLIDAMRSQKRGRNQREGFHTQGGLGIIMDDSPAALALLVEQRKSDDGRLATHIIIEGRRVK